MTVSCHVFGFQEAMPPQERREGGEMVPCHTSGFHVLILSLDGSEMF